MEAPDQRGGPILNSEEIKSIFGNIPDILSVHTKIMVQRFCEMSPNELLVTGWFGSSAIKVGQKLLYW